MPYEYSKIMTTKPPANPHCIKYPSNHFKNAILLVILISTRVAPLGSSRVSNEAKNYRELEFLGLSRYFSVIIE